ncbi:hypothetical protein PG993_014597 [Apiospora rasikravindrae]|uniref:Uncharacterized protein n=1 Tax=Apiospora rasikravindrae TaxID=990691 RepID=A0ABR1RN83_9PEZI
MESAWAIIQTAALAMLSMPSYWVASWYLGDDSGCARKMSSILHAYMYLLAYATTNVIESSADFQLTRRIWKADTNHSTEVVGRAHVVRLTLQKTAE